MSKQDKSKRSVKRRTPGDAKVRGQLEEGLQESEAIYRDLVERASDGIFIVQDAILKYSNPRALEITGRTLDETVGTPVSSYIHPDELPKLLDRYQRRMAGEHVEPIYETVMVRKDGSHVKVELNAGVITYQGKPADMVIVRDITVRKQAEEAVRESQENLRRFMDSATDSLLLLDSELNLVDVNETSLRMWGASREQVIGKNIADLSPSAVAEGRLKSYLEVIRTGAPFSVDDIITRPGFGSRHLSVRAFKVGDGLGIATSDITDRKRAEDAHRESEEKFKSLVDDMNDGYCVLQGGTVVFANARVAQMFGYDQQEVIGKTLQELLPPEVVAGLAEMHGKRQRGENVPSQYETMLVRKDGTECPVEFGARTIEFAGEPALSVVIRDISERKTAEKELQQQEQYFRSLIENSSDVIVIVNGDGTIRYTSPSIKHVLGRDPEERTARSSFDFIHPDDMGSVADTFGRVLENSGATLHSEVRAQHEDGSWRTLETATVNLLDDPIVGGIVVNFRDITERKRAEEALRESEEKYRNVVERANDGIVIVQDSIIKYINSRAASGMGYTVDQMMGTPITDYVHPDDLAPAVERYQRRMAGEDVDTISESAIVNKDGHRIEVETNTAVISYQGKPASMIIIRNISERKQMEEALRISEAYYRLLAENITDIIWTLDMDLQYTYMSPSVTRLRGFTPEEAMSLTLKKAMTPASYELARRSLTEEVESEKAGDMAPSRTMKLELEMCCKDGSTIWTEVAMTFLRDHDGKAVGIMGVTRDIAERKRMEETLRESEEKLKQYLESSPDGIYISDLKGTFLWGNREAERITGYPREELIGKSFLEAGLLAEKYYLKAAQTLEVNTSGKPTGPLELELVRKDGSVMPVEISTYPIGEGDNIEIIGIARDISERKKVEEEKQRMEQQVHLAGRLAAVGELAAGVAHELNNPLAAVQAYAQFLTSQKVLDETIRGDLETIYKEAQRASRITSNLLSFARRHKPEKAFISVNEAIEKSLELNSYRLKVNNIEISTDLVADLPWTMADFHQLQQVFVNLITNAEQAMTEAHGHGNLSIRTRKAGDIIRVTFQDNGPGIPEDIINNIFDPFYTTKEVGRGTGLGLSICYGIVDAHNGRLLAKSKPDKGTTFVMEIPIISEAEFAAREPGSVEA